MHFVHDSIFAMGAIHPPTPLSTHEQYDNDWVSINFGVEVISDVLVDGAAVVVVVASVTDDDAAAVAVVATVADAGTCVFCDDTAEDIVVAGSGCGSGSDRSGRCCGDGGGGRQFWIFLDNTTRLGCKPLFLARRFV